jgi:hypothetical protein
MSVPSDLGRRIARLQGRRAFMVDTCSVLERDVGVARARQAHREAVDSVLDAVEARFHARSLGILEGLLSAFLEDVLPRENGQPQSVSLQMETQRGLPALQIDVRNGENLEDALRGRGGSVANVLSTGLRFAALSRAGRSPLSGFVFRPFLILDEADCWIRPDRIAAFSEVIHQLSRDMGIQILMISHHSADMLKGYPVRLERNEGGELASLRVRCVPFAKQTTNDQEEAGAGGFRSIHLLNFMSHSDSDIPLHPGVTILTGDNDIGKSAVTEAFRAICYNEASDSVIRHGEDQAEVILTLENGQTLHWIRVRKGAPKVRYLLQDEHGETLRETPSPKNVPEWARNLLGVDLLSSDGKDALDVQIGDQKSPVFLLDRTPSQRAAILDMGRESQHLRRLRDQWKKQVDADRRTIREGEKKLAELQKLLQVTSDLDVLEEESILYEQVFQKTQSHLKQNAERTASLYALWQAQRALRVLEDCPDRVALPDGGELARIAAAARQLLTAQAQEKRVAVWASWTAPHLSVSLPEAETSRLLRRAERFIGLPRMYRIHALWEQWKVPPVPSLPTSNGILDARESMVRAASRLWSANQSFKRLEDLKTVDISGVSGKTGWIFQGYQMGIEAQNLRKSIRETEDSVEEEQKALTLLLNEQKRLLAEWGICPFCGQGSRSQDHAHKKETTA